MKEYPALMFFMTVLQQEHCNIIIVILLLLSVGTTDHPCDVTDNPMPTEAEIQFILKEIGNYLSPDINGLSSSKSSNTDSQAYI